MVLRGGSPETIQGVSNAPGLTAATLEDTSVTVWTVQGLISRAAMRPAAGGLNPLPGAEVDQPGILRIAEVPDDRWIVEVGGETLPVSDDASGFGIIADASSRSGPLAWSTRATWGALVVHLVVLSLLLVLAAPTARRPGARPPIRSLDTPRRSL